MSIDESLKPALFDYCLRLGDDNLILGHRLSEWCGHGPELEEDIALANISLDCVGAAQLFLRLAGALEDKGRTEDDLAYWRNDKDFRNCFLVEQPNGDFAVTIARQFLFDSMIVPLYKALTSSPYEPLAEIAAKAHKEAAYHLRHSGEWMIRLGDGTEESHRRLDEAVKQLWMFTGELFEMDEIESTLAEAGVVPDRTKIKGEWQSTLEQIFSQAQISIPASDGFMQFGARAGRHSEHLGYILAQMQHLARSHPGASW